MEHSNKVKGIFKHKPLAVELAAALILDKIKFPNAAATAILDSFNIKVPSQAIGNMKKSVIYTHNKAQE